MYCRRMEAWYKGWKGGESGTPVPCSSSWAEGQQCSRRDRFGKQWGKFSSGYIVVGWPAVESNGWKELVRDSMAAQGWYLGPRDNTNANSYPHPLAKPAKDPMKGSRGRPKEVLLGHLEGHREPTQRPSDSRESTAWIQDGNNWPMWPTLPRNKLTSETYTRPWLPIHQIKRSTIKGLGFNQYVNMTLSRMRFIFLYMRRKDSSTNTRLFRTCRSSHPNAQEIPHSSLGNHV